MENIMLLKNGIEVNTGVPLKKDGIFFFEGDEKYWLFSSGKHVDLQNPFLSKEIIGIGWDKISVEEISTLSKDELSEIFRREYLFLKDKFKDEKGFKTYITGSVNKLIRFMYEIKLGDIIVLKDRGTNKILFGKVISEVEEYNENDLTIDISTGKCNKIRRVKWIKSVEKDNVGNELKLAFTARHALSRLENEKVIEEINRQMFSYFYRGSNLHMVFQVEKKENIEFDLFKEFQDIIQEEKNKCIEETGVENIFNIKTNVQSPGPIEFLGNPEIIKYLFSVLVLAGGGVGYLVIKKKLKLKEPNLQEDDGFSGGN